MKNLYDPNCPYLPHRGPQGPNEDISTCAHCGRMSYVKRPQGETYGFHIADCSLPVDHESYCEPGGAGHTPTENVRGVWWW
jgi:hypothetical protein